MVLIARPRYVEMLEQQQSKLKSGICELYSQLQNGQGWPGQPLKCAVGGRPLIHDILERLDSLYLTNGISTNIEKDIPTPGELRSASEAFTSIKIGVSSTPSHSNVRPCVEKRTPSRNKFVF